MISKKRQIEHALIYLIPTVINWVIPLISLAIFSRQLTKEDYGVLALAEVYAVIAVGLASCGMVVAYDRNYFEQNDSPKKTGQLLSSAIVIILRNFLVIGGLTFGFREMLSKVFLGSYGYGALLFWLVCAQLCTELTSYYFIYFKNSEKAKQLALFTACQSIVSLALSLLFIVVFRWGVEGLVCAQLLSGFFLVLLLSLAVFRSIPFAFERHMSKDLMIIGFPLVPTIFLGIVSRNFNKYLLGLLASVGGVGIYGIGYKIAYMTFDVMTAFQNVFSPQVYRKMFAASADAGTAVGTYVTPFLYVSVFVGMLAALFAEELIMIATPPSYHGAINVTIILSMYFGFLFFGKINSSQIVYAKKTHLFAFITCISIALNVLLNVIMIRAWGTIGAAWATLIAALLSGIVTMAIAQRACPVRWETAKAFLIYLIFFASAAAVLAMRAHGVSYPLRLLIKTSILALYVFTGIKMQILSKDNWQAFADVILLKRFSKGEIIAPAAI